MGVALWGGGDVFRAGICDGFLAPPLRHEKRRPVCPSDTVRIERGVCT